eukprot:11792703-Heterocapsa_arctica.AAC.1
MEVDVGAPLLPRGQVHSKTFEVVAARLVDLRGVARHPVSADETLSGQNSDSVWKAWRRCWDATASWRKPYAMQRTPTWTS